MKRFLVTVFAAVIAAANISAQFVSTYFTIDEMPNAVAFLPAPPDTTSTQFVYDISQYMWGKTLRNTERGQEAIDHIVTNVADMATFFSKPFGMTISRETTPAIYKMLLTATSPKTASTWSIKVVEPDSARKPTSRPKPKCATATTFPSTTSSPWAPSSRAKTPSSPSKP